MITDNDIYNFTNIASDDDNSQPQQQEQQQPKEEFNKETVELGQSTSTGSGQQEEISSPQIPNGNDIFDELPESVTKDKENVNIQHITNYSYKRANEIAKMARADEVFIAYYRKNREAPKPGVMPDPKKLFYYRRFYYNPVDTTIAQEIKNMKDDVDRLQEISNLKNGWTDPEGNFHPPKYRENDPKITGLEDHEFYGINYLITRKRAELQDKTALEYLGIDETVKKGMEQDSLRLAIDACHYRLENGAISESKNSIYS